MQPSLIITESAKKAAAMIEAGSLKPASQHFLEKHIQLAIQAETEKLEKERADLVYGLEEAIKQRDSLRQQLSEAKKDVTGVRE